MSENENSSATRNEDDPVLDPELSSTKSTLAGGSRRFTSIEKIRTVEEILTVDEELLQERSTHLGIKAERLSEWVASYKRGGHRELRVGKASTDKEITEIVLLLEKKIRQKLVKELTNVG